MSETMVFPRFRWFVLAALCISTIATTAQMLAPATIMGVIAKEFGTDLGTTTGTIMGLFPMAVGVSCLIGGVLIDRFGFIRIALGSMILLIISSLLVPVFGHSLNGMAVLRILQGLASGPILVIISPAAALWFPRTERAIVAGLQGMSVSIGMAMGLAGGAAIFGATGNWQKMMAILSVIGIVGLIMVIVIVLGPTAPVKRAEEDPNAISDFKLALRQPVTWVGVGVFCCGSWILQAFNDLTPAYLAIEPPIGVGFGAVKAGQIMGIYTLAFAIFAGISGFIMKRIFGNRAKPVIFIGFLFAAVFCTSIMFQFVYSSTPILMMCLILAAIVGFSMPCAVAFITLSYPPYITGKIEGLWQGIGIFGGAVGVLIGAGALKNTGNYQLSITIVGIVAVVGIILSLFVKQSKAFCVNEAGIVVKTE